MPRFTVEECEADDRTVEKSPSSGAPVLCRPMVGPRSRLARVSRSRSPAHRLMQRTRTMPWRRHHRSGLGTQLVVEVMRGARLSAAPVGQLVAARIGLPEALPPLRDGLAEHTTPLSPQTLHVKNDKITAPAIGVSISTFHQASLRLATRICEGKMVWKRKSQNPMFSLFCRKLLGKLG